MLKRSAIALVALCAVGAPVAAKAETPAQFDLVCQVNYQNHPEKNWVWRIHLDMASGAWCDDDANKCDNPTPLRVYPTRVWFNMARPDKIPGVGQEMTSQWVDRQTATIHVEQVMNGVDLQTGVGPCSRAPYMSPQPQRQF